MKAKIYIRNLTVLIMVLLFITSPGYAKPISEYYQKIEDELIKKTNKLDIFLDERGSFYYDKKIEEYVNSVGRSLVPKDFNDPKVNINFKVIKDPSLNAMALPNGTVWVHTGLLAKARNEAQLAFILGHELSHILNKDGLYLYESATTNIMFAKILDIGLSAAGAFVGLYADLSQLGLVFLTQAAISGYGREKEKRSDIQGVELMSAKGYDPNEAVKIFDIFLEEKEKYQDGIEIYFLSNHPSNVFRKKELEKLIAGGSLSTTIKKTESEDYKKLTYLLTRDNLSMDINIDRLQHATEALEYLLKENPNDPANHYLLGECYRLMADDRKRLKYELNRKNWLGIDKVKEDDFKKQYYDKACAEYNNALNIDKDFVDSYKGLGLLYKSQEKSDEAIKHLERYLELNPQAKDRRFIQASISQLKEPKKEGEEKDGKKG